MTSPGRQEGELPDFTVRRSARARRVRLSVSAREGLVVTLPSHVPLAEARRAIEAKHAWATRSLARVADRRALLMADPELTLPHEIALPPVGVTLPVEYRHTVGRSPTVTARQIGGQLVVAGAVDDAEACREALRRWRDRCAQEHLPALLDEASRATGIGYERVSVRGQRTRWGSCSAAGTISLNRNLIFLPARLAGYVLLHELAHRVHPDHSTRFHELLRTLEPAAGQLRRELGQAADHVPVWADG